jgi:Putative ParB-like nuclease
MANTRDPILKPIPTLSLRPTQMTVGLREVKEKRKRWREHKSEKKRAAWRRISTGRWRRRSALPGARTRSICRAGADPPIKWRLCL